MELSENKIPVLLYHRIIKKSDVRGRHKIYAYADKFYRQMKFLKDAGYTAITFEDIHNKKVSGNKNIIITFDDGYEDNFLNAFPILKEFGFRAVVFLVTGMQRNEWGMKEGEPAIPMMKEEMLKEMLDYGFELGGHSRNHNDLTLLDPQVAMAEIAGCKTDIEQKFRNSVVSFSYPFGAINADVKQMVLESGYIFGIATNTGPENLLDDLLQIRRREIGPRTTLHSFQKKIGATASHNSFLHFFQKS